MNYLILYLTSCVAIDRDSCCDIDPMLDLHESDFSQLECMTKCILQTGLDKFSEEVLILKQTQCSYDCLGKQKGYITQEGKFLTNKFRSYADKALKELRQQKTVDKCFRKHHSGVKKEEAEYNDTELKIMYCIFKDIQLHCRRPQQRVPRKCKALQRFLKRDMQPIPRKDCANMNSTIAKFLSLFVDDEE
ncbi:hypothetical protein Trydic_g2588 [Trypoxylus dichotomus]